MYKITKNIIAIPISDFLIPVVRPSRHYHPLSYRLITATTDYYKFSFFPRAVFQWNNLPLETGLLKEKLLKKRKNSSCAAQLIDRHSNVSNLTCMFSNFRTHYSVFILSYFNLGCVIVIWNWKIICSSALWFVEYWSVLQFYSRFDVI